MKLSSRIRRALCQLTLAAGMLAAEAEYLHAAEFPVRPITLLAGFAPGSATDTVARLLAADMSARLGVPVVVDNRPGANQIVAIKTLLRSAPDGYTLLMGTGSSLVQNPAIRKSVGYHPLEDMTAIGLVAKAVGVLSASPELPLPTLRDVVTFAKANPDALAYGSSGVGMANHLAMELLTSATGTRMVHVPLKSDAAVGLELAAGRIQLGFQTLTSALPLVKSGKIRVLAHTGSGELSALPGITSVAASGITGLQALDPFTFFAVVGPNGMDEAIVARLNLAINDGLRSAAMVERLSAAQLVPAPQTSSGSAAYIRSEFAKWVDVGRTVSIPD